MTRSPLILVGPSTERRGVEFYDYSISLSHAYTDAVAAAGGIPLVFPCRPDPKAIAEAVSRADGVMLTGGDDIQPGLYAPSLPEKLQATVNGVDPNRDLVEMLLIQEVFRQRRPLLAICRGEQILNVALGGTLITDIPLEVPGTINHSRMDLKDRAVHKILIEPDCILDDIFGVESVEVNSSHHQAACKIAPGLRVTAASPDGLVEALELAPCKTPALPYLLAVQFHPERLIHRYPQFLELFRSFIRAADVTCPF